MPWIPLRGPWHPTKFPESIKCRWGSVSYKVWLSNQRPCWGGRWGRSTCQHGERTYGLWACCWVLLPRLRLGVCHLIDPHKHQEPLVDVPTHSSKDINPGPADCPGKQSLYLVPVARAHSVRTPRVANSIGGCLGICIRICTFVFGTTA